MGAGKLLRLEIRDQRKSAGPHRLANMQDKLASEASRTRRSVTPPTLASTCYSRAFARSRRSRIGHSTSGAHPSQTLVSLRSVFFIDSRLLIFPSMSAILTSARAGISPLVVLRDTRSDSSSPTSSTTNPNSSPPPINLILPPPSPPTIPYPPP